MKIILNKDVKGTGKKGDLLDIKDGFARFLIKNGDAKEANSQAINDNKFQKESEAFHVAEQKKKNKELCNTINGKTITLKVKTGENGKFFGSVTNKEISEKFAEDGIEIDKKKIILSSAIKTVGSYPVTVKISAEETAKITLLVETF